MLYRGVSAGNAKWRKEVVPKPPRKRKVFMRLTKRQPKGLPPDDACWAELLWRVFSRDAFECPRCGGRLELRAVVPGPAVSRLFAALRGATGPPTGPELVDDREART